jgi:hypothetical protein
MTSLLDFAPFCHVNAPRAPCLLAKVRRLRNIHPDEEGRNRISWPPARRKARQIDWAAQQRAEFWSVARERKPRKPFG